MRQQVSSTIFMLVYGVCSVHGAFDRSLFV
jgi:hypothetical protein